MQGCGERLGELHGEQARRAVTKPYDYVAWCARCRTDPHDEPTTTASAAAKPPTPSPTVGASTAGMVIDRFDGVHRWLSNYWAAPLTVDGQVYQSGEAAFAALKILDLGDRERIRLAPTPGDAKALGRTVTLRPGWNSTARFEAMRQVIDAKYADPDLAAKLLATGDALLIEGTTWDDLIWGGFCVCTRHRENARAKPFGPHRHGPPQPPRRAPRQPVAAGRRYRPP